MLINLTPQGGKNPLTLSREQEALIINGLRFDFADLPEGGELPADAIDTPYITGTVTRTDGQLSLCIRLPHGFNAPRETKFPEPITADLDGPIALPPFDIVTDEDGEAQEVHGEPVSVTSEGIIDWSQLVTPEHKAQEAAIARTDAIKAECRSRILAAVDETEQANIAQAGVIYASLRADGEDAATARAIAGFAEGDLVTAARWKNWVTAMQAESRRAVEDGNEPVWPSVPDGVAEMAERF